MNIAVVRLFAVVVSLVLFHQILCHSYGAPKAVCKSMIPVGHGVDGQTGASPYKVMVEKPHYTPGKNVKLSIESTSDNIKGFLIQARKMGENSTTGKFDAMPAKTKPVACDRDKGAVTHSERLAVKKLNFEWQAPEDLSGNISFFATVVKNQKTFWVKLQSPELYKMDMHVGPTSGAQLHPTIPFLFFIASYLVFLQITI